MERRERSEVMVIMRLGPLREHLSLVFHLDIIGLQAHNFIGQLWPLIDF